MGGFTGNPVIWLTIASPVSIANESIQRKTMRGTKMVHGIAQAQTGDRIAQGGESRPSTPNSANWPKVSCPLGLGPRIFVWSS